MKFFFEENMQKDVSINTTSDGSKAFLRGLVINYVAKNKREKNKRYQEIENQFNLEDDKLKKKIPHWRKLK